MTGCVLGCAQQGVHFPDCMVYDGREYAFPCDGCADEPTVGGTLVCSRCRGRFRFALREVADLVGRMRSLIDPSSATVYEDRARRTGSPSPEAPAPVAADLIDASEALQKGLWRWSPGGGWPRSDAAEAFDDAEAATAGILVHLDTWLSDGDDVFSLHRLLLERHPANEDGVREAWPVQDGSTSGARSVGSSRSRRRSPRRVRCAPSGCSSRSQSARSKNMAIHCSVACRRRTSPVRCARCSGGERLVKSSPSARPTSRGGRPRSTAGRRFSPRKIAWRRRRTSVTRAAGMPRLTPRERHRARVPVRRENSPHLAPSTGSPLVLWRLLEPQAENRRLCGR